MRKAIHEMVMPENTIRHGNSNSDDIIDIKNEQDLYHRQNSKSMDKPEQGTQGEKVRSGTMSLSCPAYDTRYGITQYSTQIKDNYSACQALAICGQYHYDGNMVFPENPQSKFQTSLWQNLRCENLSYDEVISFMRIEHVDISVELIIIQ